MNEKMQKLNTYTTCRANGWRVVEDHMGRIVVLHPGMNLDSIEKEQKQVREQQFQFPMESHLRDFVARNISNIRVNGHALRLYKGADGKTGIEYPTGVGNIDILAEDEYGTLIVFELKLNRGADRVVGQILRYMGWLKMNVAGQHDVQGVIVTPKADKKLKYAASIMPDIMLYEYDLDFTIRPIGMRA